MKEEWYTEVKKYANDIETATGILVNIIAIIGWIYSKIIGRELPRLLFGIFIIMSGISISVIVLKYLSSRKKLHKSKERRLSRLAKEYDTCKILQGKCYEREREKVWQKYREKETQIFRKKFFALIVDVFLTIVLIVSNPQNAQAFYGTMRTLMEEDSVQKTDIVDELQDEMIEEENDATESNSEEESNITRPLKPSGYQFVLEKPDVKLQISPEIEKEVFFLDEENTIRMRSYEEGWISGNGRKGVDYRTVRDEKGNSYYTFTDQETLFIQKISDSQYEDDYFDWIKHAPTSTELQNYMKGFEHLNEIVKNGAQGCWELWWHLANDNQRFAQEYSIQTDNDQTIVYYYAMSIYCCMEALTYEISKKDYEMIFHYMVMRYHDLFSEETKVAQIYKNRSEELYQYFVSYDHKLSNSKNDR
ncbi:MAG: hypothetical protein LUD07_02690 [Clostridiales bacterium]|nr:hypothetical protein [Clostridiales bacterium]